MHNRLHIFGASGFVGGTLTTIMDEADAPYAAYSSKDIDLTAPASARQVADAINDGDSVAMLSALTPEKGDAPALALQNVAMVAHLIEGLKHQRVKQVMYISSDAVFPLSQDVISEDTPLVADRSYGHMHILREQLLREAIAPGALTILRPCAIYGEGGYA